MIPMNTYLKIDIIQKREFNVYDLYYNKTAIKIESEFNRLEMLIYFLVNEERCKVYDFTEN